MLVSGDTTKIKPENDLNTVAKALSAAINGGQFIVKLRDPVTLQVSINTDPRPESRY